MERMTGPDAVMLHLERPTVPMHTLKIAVLDSLDRGRPITLTELREPWSPYLGLVPRATQKVMAVAGCGGRPYWVHDAGFDLDRPPRRGHLGVPHPSAAFDALCARLAERHLDRERPLWSMTLVHGLQDGHQAVVVRLHHAVSDGLGALNTFLAATTDRPGAAAPPVAVSARSPRRPRRAASRTPGASCVAWSPGLPRLVGTGRSVRRSEPAGSTPGTRCPAGWAPSGAASTPPVGGGGSARAASSSSPSSRKSPARPAPPSTASCTA